MRLRRTIFAGIAGVLAIGLDLDTGDVPESASASKGACPTRAAMSAIPGPTSQLFEHAALRTALRPGIDTSGVLETLDALGYDIERVRRGDLHVPRLVLASLPHDLRAADFADTRKDVFLAAVLPAVLIVNETVLAQRHILQTMRLCETQGLPLSPDAEAWLQDLADLYEENPDVDRLLTRVDAVPPSLVLAQAAVESGWGTSRIAREGNALFGEYVFGRDGAATARGRPLKNRARLKAFDHVAESVLSYVRNLNTHPAYEGFRIRRAELRDNGDPLDGYVLAGELARYSTRGHAYVRSIRSVIRANELHEFDTSRLSGFKSEPRA